MSDPVLFESASPRFALPLLYSGQAQKEIFVNEAFSHVDALLHCSIEEEMASPPASQSSCRAVRMVTSSTAAIASVLGQSR